MRPVSKDKDATTPKELKDSTPQFAHVLTGAVTTTPQKSLLTPVKTQMTGQQLYHTRQSQTPGANLAYLHVASPHLLKTPGSGRKFRTPGSASGRRGTPRVQQHGFIQNPFEAGLLDHLNSPMVSPNVFKITEPDSLEKTPESFRWSIDQMASLKPVPIEEMPENQVHAHVTDLDVERKAQTDINRFFENHAVVPSPWTDSTKKRLQLPRTPGLQPDTAMCESTQVEGRTSLGRKDVACQTGLTLPVDFDLQKVLGEYYMHAAQTNEEANLSTSSLRRKLFFHGDEGTPLSPVKGCKSQLADAMDLSCFSPLVSPVKHHTPLRTGQLSPFNTPGSDHFSSSPVHKPSSSHSRSNAKSGLRRCSTTSELALSPQLSPIGSQADSSKELCHNEQTSLRHAPWQATPSPGFTDLTKQLMSSPGMSPIATGDGSFMDSSHTLSCGRSALNGLGRRRCMQRVPAPEDPRSCGSPQFARRSTNRCTGRAKLPVNSDDEDMGMDISSHYFTSPRTSQEKPALDMKSASAFSEIHDESTNQGLCLQMDMLSHDTGYQTNSQDTGYSNSLHLTNQDAPSSCHSMSARDAGQHCDLTNPFGQLPLLQDSEIQMTSDALSTGRIVQEKPEPDGDSFNEERIIRKARILLGKEPEQAVPEGAGDTKKLVLSTGLPAFVWHLENAALEAGDNEQPAVVADSAHILPSVLASQVLKRAGEDLALYCKPENDGLRCSEASSAT